MDAVGAALDAAWVTATTWAAVCGKLGAGSLIVAASAAAALSLLIGLGCVSLCRSLTARGSDSKSPTAEASTALPVTEAPSTARANLRKPTAAELSTHYRRHLTDTELRDAMQVLL